MISASRITGARGLLPAALAAHGGPARQVGCGGTTRRRTFLRGSRGGMGRGRCRSSMRRYGRVGRTRRAAHGTKQYSSSSRGARSRSCGECTRRRWAEGRWGEY
ncbi:hypothetical protein C8J57DRAFT_401972 [Mycena rebaudengoi]|nr:hypothetical protein C8J57DRAFT_401972 [Mycena rebaudengoi]